MSRITGFLAYLESKVGNVYVWGAQGQALSDMKDPVGWITSREQKNGESCVKRAIAFYQKVKASGKNPIEAYDCSGLIMYYIQNLKGWAKSDSSAQGLYASSTKITKAQLQTGDLVFIIKPEMGTMRHVGVYIEDGQTIEAYGRDRGVVKLPLSQGEWTHYGRLPVLQVIDNNTKEEIKMTKVIAKNLIVDEDVRKLQAALNALGYPCGEPDGKAGNNTMAGIAAFCAAHGATIEAPVALPDAINLTVEISGKRYGLTLNQA